MLSEETIKEARLQDTVWWPITVNNIIEDPRGWQAEEYAWNHDVTIWYAKIPMNYFRISGPDATKLLSDTCINKYANNKPGTVKQAMSCREDGKLVLDTLALVTAENTYELSGFPARFTYMIEKFGPYDVTIEQVEPRTLIQVAGPKSFELLSELTDYDLPSIKFAHFNVEPMEFAGFDDVRMCRFGMTNELGFEIQSSFSNLDAIVQKVFEVGEKYNIRQIGCRNHLVQHMEGGQLSFYYGDGIQAVFDEGDPYTEYLLQDELSMMLRGLATKISGSYEPREWSDFYLSPVDLGMAKRIDFSKDFIGKEALAAEAANPTRKFVTLEWNAEDVVDVYASMFADGPAHERLDTPHYDYMEIPRDPRLPMEASRVLVDGKDVAFTTSRTYMYSFRKMVSNCLMPLEYTEPGTQVTVIWGEPGHPQKEIRATVQTHPYKPYGYKSLPTD